MIEKSIHNQTQDYLQRNELPIKTNHSTDTCLSSRLKGIILNGVENGKHAGMILIDL